MDERLLKPYNPTETEARIYQQWETKNYFKPAGEGEVFSMVLPPPNVTGTLHMGSALMLAIEDVMVRYARMTGKRALWIPGTDHAAIATQTKVEKLLQKEGIRKQDLGREKFLQRVNTFAQESHDVIVKQIRTMGCSIDWSREAFTLDEARSRAVREAFKRMYDAGLIFRGYRIVNWDPKGQTTISDDEIVYEERPTALYTFRYAKDFPIAIATTRPETKLGDTGVAVHPDDKRYQKFIGREYEVNFAGTPLKIKIIADKEVDPTFGTGALGITPAHSQIDAEIAKRHNLSTIQVIDEYAQITASGEFQGKKVVDARGLIVTWLKNNNLLEKEEQITHNIATAERTGGIIEPLPKLQWFVNVNKEFTPPHSDQKVTLKQWMRQVVDDGRIKIIPEHFVKVYSHWIDNLHDWCISRQIWYGHRLPVWYRPGNDKPSEIETYVGIEAPSGEGWEQDSDTLDTWFSSGLWTFSTLGWPGSAKASPGKPDDLATFHPITILETGYDILFFWVARMIMMTGFLLGNIPFKTVYLHGIVRDSQGRKISKSLGNNIDPIDMIAKYGADAVRMSLIIGVGPGNDSKIDEQKIKAYKHFANKIWNASRFVIEHNQTWTRSAQADHPYLQELNQLVQEITADMDNYRYYLASEKLYHYFWHTFADKIIEEAKGNPTLNPLLLQILITCLILLHPFMPFVTEEIWSLLPAKVKPSDKLLIASSWPS
jgi:valyl-tRNA synthetase